LATPLVQGVGHLHDGLITGDTATPGSIANFIDPLHKDKPCGLFVAGNDANLYVLNHENEMSGLQKRYQEVLAEATKRLMAHSKREAKTDAPPQETLF